ncbi:MAG: GNAT family N-acetyltransferase [Tissierellia bacterium]|nr:GNAT family N-acetyltransferase [Tissierellia bacterium]
MKLVRPHEKYWASYKEAYEEDEKYRKDLLPEDRCLTDPMTIIEKAKRFEKGIDLPQNYVSSTYLWLIDDEKFIGQINIRHRLTEKLMHFGGHIGDEIRYTESRKGYGTKMLALALEFAKEELGLHRVLITCFEDNIGSRKVIERNGGRLEGLRTVNVEGGKTLRRYWIER